MANKRIPDNISEAIEVFIDKIASNAGNEPLDGDETERITAEVGERLDRFFANEPARKYARVAWSIEDVFSEADSQDIEINEEEAENFLKEGEDVLKEEMIKAGWHVIGQALRKKYGG